MSVATGLGDISVGRGPRGIRVSARKYSATAKNTRYPVAGPHTR